MNITRAKNCHCYTCQEDFHWLGIARHRAMHRDKKQDCKISFTSGDIGIWRYSEKVKAINGIN